MTRDGGTHLVGTEDIAFNYLQLWVFELDFLRSARVCGYLMFSLKPNGD